MLKGIVISIGLVVIWFVVQLTIVHLFSVKQRIRFVSLSYLFTFVFYLFLYFLIDDSTFSYVGLFNGLFLQGIFFFTYLACHYYVERPITLRILVELFQNRDRERSLYQLEREYTVSSMVKKRLEAMVRGRLIQMKGERYFLERKGLFIARMVLLGRSCLNQFFLKSKSS